MSKVLTVVRKEYLERVKSKAFLIGTLIGPVFMAALILGPALLADVAGDQDRTVAVIDRTGTVAERLRATLAEILLSRNERERAISISRCWVIIASSSSREIVSLRLVASSWLWRTATSASASTSATSFASTPPKASNAPTTTSAGCSSRPSPSTASTPSSHGSPSPWA